MKNKKILFIVNGFEVGGVETYVRNVNQKLKKIGVRTYLHCWDSHLKNDPDLFDSFKLIKADGSLIPFTGQVLNFIKHNISLFRFLLKIKPNLVILNVNKSAFYSYPLLKILRAFLNYKIIYQFHGSEYLEKTNKIKIESKVKKFKYQIYYQLEKFLYNNLDQILVFSKFSKYKILNGFFGVNAQKIKVIKPGKTLRINKIDEGKQLKKELGLDPDQPFILTVTRLEIRKGMFEILKILQQIYKIDKNINFVIISNYTSQYDSDQKVEFFKKYQQLSPQPIIKFLQISEKDSLNILYNAADIFLIPSISMETFGFTTLESFCHGTPVAGYKIGANPELIINNFNGFIRPLSERDLLVNDIMNYLKRNKKYKKIMANNCIKTARKYSWTKYIYQIINI